MAVGVLGRLTPFDWVRSKGAHMNALLHRLSSGTVELPNQHVGAAFAEVTYGGNKTTLVNIDCSVIHLLLHLRAKCIGDGFDIDGNIRIEGSGPGGYIKWKRHPTVTCDENDDRETKDGLIRDARPLLTEPPVDLHRRIISAIRTMDRFKPRVEKTRAEPKRKGNKKKQ